MAHCRKIGSVVPTMPSQPIRATAGTWPLSLFSNAVAAASEGRWLQCSRIVEVWERPDLQDAAIPHGLRLCSLGVGPVNIELQRPRGPALLQASVADTTGKPSFENGSLEGSDLRQGESGLLIVKGRLRIGSGSADLGRKGHWFSIGEVDEFAKHCPAHDDSEVAIWDISHSSCKRAKLVCGDDLPRGREPVCAGISPCGVAQRLRSTAEEELRSPKVPRVANPVPADSCGCFGKSREGAAGQKRAACAALETAVAVPAAADPAVGSPIATLRGPKRPRHEARSSCAFQACIRLASSKRRRAMGWSFRSSLCGEATIGGFPGPVGAVT
mmetsp:Transcript_74729/g.173072  ORF Transcript_74729/g.173072 Transcript_74729/m.173072 type:complete len:328 (+) Transcript_74729:45-1028(+)